MARIQDYASLAQAIQDFSHRPTLAPFVDYFIQDGEDRLYTTILELMEGSGLMAMEAALSGAIDATTGTLAVPSGFLSLKNAYLETDVGNPALTRKSSQWIYEHYPLRTAQGMPSFIAIENGAFIFGPFPDDAYDIGGTYYARAAGLSAANSTTWMTTDIPQTLLAACMISVGKWLKDPQAVQQWNAEMQERLGAICAAEKAARYTGGDLAINASMPVPPGW